MGLAVNAIDFNFEPHTIIGIGALLAIVMLVAVDKGP
jgi:hypothetical protein